MAPLPQKPPRQASPATPPEEGNEGKASTSLLFLAILDDTDHIAGGNIYDTP